MQKKGAYFWVGVAVAFNALSTLHQLTLQAPPGNDHLLHLAAIRRAIETFAAGENPLDHVLPDFGLGFALFAHYQHLPHLLTALPAWLLTIDAARVMSVCHWLVWALFPWVVYRSARGFDLTRTQAAFAALCAPLIATDRLFGFELSSYGWRGFGLYTQLWSMCLLFFTWATLWRALATPRLVPRAGLLLALLLPTHALYGYYAALMVPVFVLLRGRPLRALAALLLMAVIASYFWLPHLLQHDFVNRSVFEASYKYDSYGAQWVLRALAAGELFDHGRISVLSGLLALGLVFAGRLPRLLFFAALLVYFGRATWGPLIDLVPLSRDMHMHRFIAGVHLAGVLLIGIGLARFPLAVLLLIPAAYERLQWLGNERAGMRETEAAFVTEAEDLASLDARLNALLAATRGRVYSSWQDDARIGQVPFYSYLAWTRREQLGFPYHALSPANDATLRFDEHNRRHYTLFDVRYVIADARKPQPTFLTHDSTHGRWAVWTTETDGPFALVDSTILVSGTPVYDLGKRWLESSLPLANEYPAWSASVSDTHPFERRIEPSDPLLGVNALPACGVVSQKKGTFAATRPCVLMMKVAYHPGWQCWIDDVRVPTFAVVPGFVAARVSAGEHAFRFVYQAHPAKKWLALAGVSVALMTTLWSRSTAAARRRRQ